MFQLGKTIVSEDIIEKDFVCNLSVCKGACCIDGDAGAPLDKEEVKILEDIYPKVKPFLRKEGIAVIEEHAGQIEQLCVLHAACDDVDTFVEQIKAVVNVDVLVGQVGPVVGAHAGLGTIGVAFQTTR